MYYSKEWIFGFFRLWSRCKARWKCITFLFSLYINDLEKILNDNDVQSLNLIYNFCIENITTYLRILILLDDDDVLLISESTYGLQNALNAFSLYCKQWKMKVSTNKTEIMVFSKRKFGIDSFFLFDKH